VTPLQAGFDHALGALADTSSGIPGMDRALQKSALLMEQLRNHDIELRRRRNAALPVSRLPIELLVRVWTEAMKHTLSWHERIDDRIPNWLPESRDLSCIFALSQVCYAWRRAFVELPALWTCVDLERAEEMSAEVTLRSHNLPLVITYMRLVDSGVGEGRGTLPNKVRDLLEACMPRTQDLCLQMPFINDDALLAPAPILESLHIFCDAEIFSEQQPIKLPTYAPRLRTLSLHTHGLPLQSPILSRVTRLALEGTNYNRPHHVMNMLGVIEQCPRLTELVIQIGSRDHDIQAWLAQTERPVINLPELTRAMFVSEFMCTVPFLRTLRAAPTATLEIRGHSYTWHEGARALADLLKTQFPFRSEGRAPVEATIRDQPMADRLTISLIGSSDSVSTIFELGSFSEEENGVDHVRTLLPCIPWDELQTLHVHIFDNYALYDTLMSIILDTFKTSTSLRTLDISCTDDPKSHAIVIRSLHQSPQEPRFLFPSLSSLTIGEMTLATVGENILDDVKHETHLSALLRVLEARAKGGAGIVALTLQNCDFGLVDSALVKEMLSKWVPNVAVLQSEA
jgi:hypothetical protein